MASHSNKPKTPFWRQLTQVSLMVIAYALLFTDIRPLELNFLGYRMPFRFSEFQWVFFTGLLMLTVGVALGVFSVTARRNTEPAPDAPSEPAAEAPASAT